MFNQRLDELTALLKSCHYTTDKGPVDADTALQMQSFLINQVAEQKGSVYVIGNGGSSAIASHIVIDLLNAVGVRAHGFTDASTLTCFANDYGYEEVYCSPLEVCLSPQDVVIAISSSGQSENILRAARLAVQKNVALITFSGFASLNPLRSLGTLNIWLDSHDYGLVETGHFFLLHTLIDFMVRQRKNKLAASVV
ncbi:MAG: SIS domain-containing protein [Verrucomicrobia bacterium]|nr:SIS domain-containing protein [Verrucomicrobiota bacterium]MBS0646378.1 SIS domain-containing protein [Verrucomicrobiota bacterium]